MEFNGLYIKAANAIGISNSFALEHISALEKPDNQDFQAIKFKDYLSVGRLRRMSQILKVGNVAGITTVNEAALTCIDGVIVGTGLGCLTDTQKFLNQLIERNETALSPTAFIQSTHNTLAGQLGAHFKCHQHNQTIVQRQQTMQNIIIDAYLQLQGPSEKNILAGTVDELTEYSAQLIKKVENKDALLGQGASFFILSNQSNDTKAVAIDSLVTNQYFEEVKYDFNAKYGHNALVLRKANQNGATHTYEDYSGAYWTSNGFGLWMGYRLLMHHKGSILIELIEDQAYLILSCD
ncbi:beta-ketoacyl synthase chain length factor [Persicobacter psychrovividus]|uniref:3-oxoacyl-ACP synthase n=1 Tax=Persicobacter psychrovividus TaxID=387638 RepID=A0ABM7VMC9_9BACT|nr:3-oxoacyl-ACP synthase [Persicobacter psychrovividus]